MNIYALDEDPLSLVRALTDRHLGSTLTIAAALLCNAHIANDGASAARERVSELTLPPDISQSLAAPWARFTAASIANYDWISQVLWLGCDEFELRSQRLHSYAIDRDSVLCLRRQLANPPLAIPMVYTRSVFPICVPFLFRSPDSVKSYRRFYIQKYRSEQKAWSQNRLPPVWLNEEVEYS